MLTATTTFDLVSSVRSNNHDGDYPRQFHSRTAFVRVSSGGLLFNMSRSETSVSIHTDSHHQS